MQDNKTICDTRIVPNKFSVKRKRRAIRIKSNAYAIGACAQKYDSYVYELD